MKSPIVICTQTFPPKMGGMEAVMASLAEHFTHAGYAVSVFADAPFKNLKNYDFYAAQVPKFIRPCIKSRQISQKATPEAWVICDSWKSVGAVPKSFEKIVVLAHGQEYLNKEKKRRRIEQALKRASLVVASSNATADMVRNYAADALPIHTIYPTYMLGSAENSSHQRSATIEILSLSRVERRKGLFQSAEAISQLPEELKQNLHWAIAGDGPDRAELERYITALGLNATFLGRVSTEKKHELYSSADLFLMPSYQEGNSLEGFGITYIEAAAYGVASIGGLAGGASEAVIDGQTGWSVDGSSADEIHVALKEALSDPQIRVDRGLRGLRRFEQSLAGEKAFARLADLIQQP